MLNSQIFLNLFQFLYYELEVRYYTRKTNYYYYKK